MKKLSRYHFSCFPHSAFIPCIKQKTAIKASFRNGFRRNLSITKIRKLEGKIKMKYSKKIFHIYKSRTIYIDCTSVQFVILLWRGFILWKFSSWMLKGHGNEADFLGFLQKLGPHRSLTLPFEPFRFWIRIRGDIRNRKTTPRLAESGSWLLNV